MLSPFSNRGAASNRSFLCAIGARFVCLRVCLCVCVFFLFFFSLLNYFNNAGQEFDQYATIRARPGLYLLCRDSDLLLTSCIGSTIVWSKGLSNLLLLPPDTGLAGSEFLAHCASELASLERDLESHHENFETAKKERVGSVFFFFFVT